MDEEAARELHSRAVVIDSHNDSTVAYIRRGNLGLNGEREWEADGFSHTLSYAIDAERARMVGWVISSSNS